MLYNSVDKTMKVSRNEKGIFEIELPTIQKVNLTQTQVEEEIVLMEQKEAEYDKQLIAITEAKKNVTTHKKEMQEILKEIKKVK